MLLPDTNDICAVNHVKDCRVSSNLNCDIRLPTIIGLNRHSEIAAVAREIKEPRGHNGYKGLALSLSSSITLD